MLNLIKEIVKISDVRKFSIITILDWRNEIMMLYPPVADLVDKIGSRYQLVNLVARRARAIANEAEEKQIPLDKKRVSAAVDEVFTGKLSIK